MKSKIHYTIENVEIISKMPPFWIDVEKYFEMIFKTYGGIQLAVVTRPTLELPEAMAPEKYFPASRYTVTTQRGTFPRQFLANP